jgi:large repetitive protein
MGRLFAIFVLGGALVLSAPASGGGIADEPCPNLAGENTHTCPAGTIYAPYDIRFREKEGSGCGPGRQTFHLDWGVLPAGLNLGGDGRLSGTPLEVGRFRFYVEMREPQDDPVTCAGKETQKEFTLWIRKPLSIALAGLPTGEVGVPFRARIRARGGSSRFSWRRTSGVLPSGVRMLADGSIAGTPRRAGAYEVEVAVEDTERRTATWVGTLRVARPLVIRTRQLPVATLGSSYSARLVADGGIAPLRWELTHGRLPRGIRFGRTLGRFIGTPKERGVRPVTVRVRDGLGGEAAATFRIVVRPRGSEPETNS